MGWFEVLRGRVQQKGLKQVAEELGFSPSTISKVLSGRYGARTEKVQRRVEALLSAPAVPCPLWGPLSPLECSSKHRWAKEVRLRGTGNPETLRAILRCRACPLRNGGDR